MNMSSISGVSNYWFNWIAQIKKFSQDMYNEQENQEGDSSTERYNGNYRYDVTDLSFLREYGVLHADNIHCYRAAVGSSVRGGFSTQTQQPRPTPSIVIIELDVPCCQLMYHGS